MKVRVLAVAIGVLAAIVTVRSTVGAQEGASPPQPPATAPRSVWDGVYTDAQAKRGEEIYVTHCVVCHGEALEGNGPVTPLIGDRFSANWNGVSMGDMLERTRTSMPMTKPGSLSRQQTADVLAFILSANKFPAGQVELSRQPEMLNQIKFLSEKP